MGCGGQLVPDLRQSFDQLSINSARENWLHKNMNFFVCVINFCVFHHGNPGFSRKHQHLSKRGHEITMQKISYFRKARHFEKYGALFRTRHLPLSNHLISSTTPCLKLLTHKTG